LWKLPASSQIYLSWNWLVCWKTFDLMEYEEAAIKVIQRSLSYDSFTGKVLQYFQEF